MADAYMLKTLQYMWMKSRHAPGEADLTGHAQGLVSCGTSPRALLLFSVTLISRLASDLKHEFYFQKSYH